MALIYLDEDHSRECEALLSGYGHSVVRAREIGHRQMPDSDHLRYAADSGRILLTYNRRDYELLHLLWLALRSWGVMNRAHAGILTTWGQIPVNDWAELVHNFLLQTPNIENQLWRRQQQEWERVGW